MVRIPILTYHEISSTPDPSYLRFTVTPAQFERQMTWLARKGYRTITLDELVAHQGVAQTLPRKPCVITFDDGCLSAAGHASAILPRFGFTATFYLVTAMVGTATMWARERRLPLMDWNMARHLLTLGFTCGSHTDHHRRLAQVSPRECEEELRRSREVLQDRLGREIAHLSYPHGAWNPEVRRLAAAAGYRTACTVDSGLATAHGDLLALPRVRVCGDEPFRDFTWRVRTSRPLAQLLPQPLPSLAARTARLFTGRSR